MSLLSAYLLSPPTLQDVKFWGAGAAAEWQGSLSNCDRDGLGAETDTRLNRLKAETLGFRCFLWWIQGLFQEFEGFWLMGSVNLRGLGPFSFDELRV